MVLDLQAALLFHGKACSVDAVHGLPVTRAGCCNRAAHSPKLSRLLEAL